MNRDEIIEQTARVLACLERDEEWPTNESLGGGLTGTRDDEFRQEMIDQATELWNAGLLAHPAPTRDDVRRVLENEFWPFLAHNPFSPETFWWEATDAVMALMKGQDS